VIVPVFVAQGQSVDPLRLKVMRSVWDSHVNEPKTRKSKAPVPIIGPLQRLLDQYRLSVGSPATGVMFATMKGTPVGIKNVLNRQILPVLNACAHCGKGGEGSRPGGSQVRNEIRCGQSGMAGTHSGEDLRRTYTTSGWTKTTQAILRHAHVAVTQTAYIKTLAAQSVAAMRQLEALVNVKLLSVGDQANCAPLVHRAS
jgi:integrase